MRIRRSLTATFLLIGLLAGCASDDDLSIDPPSEPLPDPVAAPSTPESAPVTSLVILSTTNLQDVDGSGTSTQLPFAAYLYAHPHPAPKWERGTFEFALYSASAAQQQGVPTAEPLATWSWDADQAFSARSENLVGRFYTFLIDFDQRNISLAGVRGFQFLVRFTPEAGGPTVRSALKTVWCQ